MHAFGRWFVHAQENTCVHNNTGGVSLKVLYNKEICHLQLKKVDLYVCPASFIISRVSDQLIL